MRYSYPEESLLYLEKKLLSTKQLRKRYKNIPKRCLLEAYLASGSGSIGIGKSKEGWFVLCSAGQGPAMVWHEE
jgi:hypothetical protein